jgi:hypothetical protein
MTQPYPFTQTADTQHAKASAATRLRSSRLVGSDSPRLASILTGYGQSGSELLLTVSTLSQSSAEQESGADPAQIEASGGTCDKVLTVNNT